jgi:hypothetical protein
MFKPLVAKPLVRTVLLLSLLAGAHGQTHSDAGIDSYAAVAGGSNMTMDLSNLGIVMSVPLYQRGSPMLPFGYNLAVYPVSVPTKTMKLLLDHMAIVYPR